MTIFKMLSKVILFLVFFCYSVLIFARTNDVNLYIDKANKLKIYNDSKWLALIHYKKTVFNNYKSLIINREFFFSKQGRKNPQKEMEATIVAFFSSEIKETEEKQHPICQFPARFEFLNSYLKFDKKLLPNVNCERFIKFYDEISPSSLSIIFPTTYMNNPASMFGHTLIRIDRSNSDKDGIDINSIIINYGADTLGEDNGIIYAIRGVFGLYKGFFSATQYYKMINLYNNLENRDIWEYQLDYNKNEASLYTKHIWELLSADMKYYFFQKNCSYLMLESLNILRPNINLTESFQVYTAPIDTLKVLENNNLILNKKYRPSLQQQIFNNSTFLKYDEKKFVKQIIINKEPDFEIQSENKNLIFETAYKLLGYEKVKNKMDLNEYRKKSFKILQNINEKDVYSLKEYKIENPISPEEGHKIGRFSLSFGRFNNENYMDFGFKPSYHELIDNNIGFDSHSEISFFETKFRYFLSENKLDLETLNFIKIKSLPVRNYFFRPISFSVLFGINNLYNDYKVLLLDLNGGFSFGSESLSTFFLIGPKINYSGLFYSDFTLGINAAMGAFVNLKYFKFILSLKTNKLIQNEYNYDLIEFDSNIIATKNFFLNIKYSKYFYDSFKNKNDISAGIKILF